MAGKRKKTQRKRGSKKTSTESSKPTTSKQSVRSHSETNTTISNIQEDPTTSKSSVKTLAQQQSTSRKRRRASSPSPEQDRESRKKREGRRRQRPPSGRGEVSSDRVLRSSTQRQRISKERGDHPHRRQSTTSSPRQESRKKLSTRSNSRGRKRQRSGEPRADTAATEEVLPEAKSQKVATGSCASTRRRESRSSAGSGSNRRAESGSSATGATAGSRGVAMAGNSPNHHPDGPGSASYWMAPSSASQQQLLEQLGMAVAAHAQEGGSTHPAPSSSTAPTGAGPTGAFSQRFSFSGRSGGPEGLDHTFQSLMDEVDIGRLQSILEARGVPSHSLFSNPRMHQMAQQMAGHNLGNTVNQRISQMQAAGTDWSMQHALLQDINQSLLIGYEEHLTSIHAKQLVACVMEMLRNSDSEELKSLGCNVLSHMMDVLPRSSDAVVPAIPLLIETMDNSAHVDIFERVINALEHIARRHGRTVLQNGGIAVVMRLFDFLESPQQRMALTLVSNCFQALTPDDFPLIADCLPGLTERIKLGCDAKCVQIICTCFSRLVEAYQTNEGLLKKIAAHNLFPNLQNLLMASPPIITNIQEVIHMLATMCANCSDLAVVLMRQNIAETLSFILVGASSADKASVVSQSIDNRRQEETYEIVHLIAELMPRLPTEGQFTINRVLFRARQSAAWSWLSDSGDWTGYSLDVCAELESAHRRGLEDTIVTMGTRRFFIDFRAMHQQNMETNVTRRIQRQGPPEGSSSNESGSPGHSEARLDSRAEVLREQAESGGTEASDVIRILFPLLLDVFGESSSANVRYKCLEAMLRMTHHTTSAVLEEVLSQCSISSIVASMMASSDARVAVGALQMARMLLEKLPHIFLVYFKKEGVLYQLDRLVESRHPLLNPPSLSSTPTSAGPASSQSSLFQSGGGLLPAGAEGAGNTPPGPGPSSSASVLPGSGSRLSDIFRRNKRGAKSGRRSSKDEHPYAAVSAASADNITVGESRLSGSGAGTSGSSASKRQNFLSHLNPARWTRGGAGSSAGAASGASSAGPATPRHLLGRPSRGRSSSASLTPPYSGPPRDQQVRQWILEQSKRLRVFYDELITQHEVTTGRGVDHAATRMTNDVLPLLETISSLLSNVSREGALDESGLDKLSHLLTEGVDLSPFEMQHSGLIQRITDFLTADDHRDARLRAFFRIFLHRTGCVEEARLRLDSRLPSNVAPTPFSALVSRLMACLHQQEQFQVRGHGGSMSSLGDPTGASVGGSLSSHLESHPHHLLLSSGAVSGGASSSRRSGEGALKCELTRHPQATDVPNLISATVKIDPLTTVQDLEHYLIRRGLLRSNREPHSSDSSSGEEEEPIDESIASINLSGRSSLTSGGSRRGQQRPGAHGRLQLVLDNHPLQPEMPLFQAVKRFSPPVQAVTGDLDNEDQINQAIWSCVHTIHYRLSPSNEAAVPNTSCAGASGLSSGSRAKKSRGGEQVASSTSSFTSTNKRRRKDELWTDGQVPVQSPALLPYLVRELPVEEGGPKLNDPSAPTLALLRMLSAINRYWHTLDSALDPFPLLPSSEFVSGKLSVKANRQLQDAFSVLAGNLPNWLVQLVTTCPFIFPFDTRQNFFYAYNFDRDRTILRLQELHASEGDASASSERLPVQMKRHKVTVTRGDRLLKQAEKTLCELDRSRAMLEIAFDGEVGFGLGPTLEFYTLVSRELMRAQLGLWRGENQGEHTVPPTPGLYPRPLPRNVKAAQNKEAKCKFQFLGRLLARALLDCRQLDLPLSPVIFKWLQGQSASITPADLDLVDPDMARHVRDLWTLVEKRRAIERNSSLSAQQREEAIGALGVDELYLCFVLPGYKIELQRNGQDTPVTADNLDTYLRLVCHWTLVEGVSRQMEAMLEGFESVLSPRQLGIFSPEELEGLFCGSGPDHRESWDVKTLMETCCCDHGYTMASRSISHLFEIMASFSQEERRLFLQFVTGSPRLPVGGFRSLKPPLKIVLKREDCDNPDRHLPSVMTCQNYLKLPDYSTKDLMREKLVLAIREGQLAFHLS